MDLGIKGHVAVVCGGANGIGRAIAESFAREGASLAVVDIAQSAGVVAGEISAQFNVLAAGWSLNVTDYSAVQRVSAEIAEKLGECRHVLFAVGAGSGKYGFPFWDLEPSDWDRVLQVNLLGAVHVAHAFAPRMVERRRGTFLFISSVAGQIGSQTDPPYSAAKAALINFAQCAAKDLAPYNIRVNTICPGMIQTSLNQSVWKAWHDKQPPDRRRSYEDWAGEKVQKVAPLARWQRPEDVAELAVFLASHRAENITGQTMNVDGGQVMHW